LRFSTNFKSYTRGSGLGVINSLGAGLDVRADTVVVAGMESMQIAESVEGNGVVRSVVTDSSRVTGDFALCDVISSFGTDEEAIASKDGISCDRGAL
jgi:acetyl-CoA acetyltransferase